MPPNATRKWKAIVPAEGLTPVIPKKAKVTTATKRLANVAPIKLKQIKSSNAQGSTKMVLASWSSASSLRSSAEIEEVEDGDKDCPSRNVSPSNASQLIESDRSGDDEVGIVGKRVRASSVIDVNDGSSDGVPVVEETAEAERAHLLKDWNSPIYAFFHCVPSIDYVGNPARWVHVFECN
ncbi:hypothetical protein BC826DRAFT_1113611 [Russula brevipes]|nr:hypothetical protein BC826DRAFT_1113611 [Russula brevipes]